MKKGRKRSNANGTVLKFIRKIMRTAEIAQTAETAALLELSAPLAPLKQCHLGQTQNINMAMPFGSNAKYKDQCHLGQTQNIKMGSDKSQCV